MCYILFRMKKAFFLVLVIFMSVSCSRNEQTPEIRAEEPVPETVSEAGSSRIDEIEKSILESRNIPDKIGKKLSGENYGSRRFLLARPGEPVYPADFLIGKIASEAPEEGSPEGILASFFESYGKKSLRQESARLFTAESRIMLTVLFEEWAEEGYIPTALRFGESRREEGNTEITVRCFRDRSSCACEFKLTREEGNWKICSFSGNLAELDLPYTEPEELFEPEVYYFF